MHAIAAAPGCADDGPVWRALDRLADAALPRRCAASWRHRPELGQLETRTSPSILSSASGKANIIDPECSP